MLNAFEVRASYLEHIVSDISLNLCVKCLDEYNLGGKLDETLLEKYLTMRNWNKSALIQVVMCFIFTHWAVDRPSTMLSPIRGGLTCAIQSPARPSTTQPARGLRLGPRRITSVSIKTDQYRVTRSRGGGKYPTKSFNTRTTLRQGRLQLL